MKKLLLISILISCTNFWANTTIVEVFGDLTGDAIEEKIKVSQLEKKNEFGFVRLLEIFVKEKNNWKLLASSENIVYGSESGGLHGDAFHKDFLSVEEGLLKIHHSGGEKWKWESTHYYKFVNKRFEYIMYHFKSSKECEYEEEYTYDLQTGKVVFDKKYQICKEKTGLTKNKKVLHEEFTKRPKQKFNFSNINIAERRLVTPKYKEVVYY